MPTSGNSETYTFYLSRQSGTGGGLGFQNTGLSFTVTRRAPDSVSPDPDAPDPNIDQAGTGDYGLIVYGPNGGSFVITPSARTVNIIAVGELSLTARHKHHIYVGFGAQDEDNVLVDIVGPEGRNRLVSITRGYNFEDPVSNNTLYPSTPNALHGGLDHVDMHVSLPDGYADN